MVRNLVTKKQEKGVEHDNAEKRRKHPQARGRPLGGALYQIPDAGRPSGIGYVYAKTYAEARQKKQEALAARKPERPDAHGESLGAVMLLWLNGKKSSVKPSTYANYSAIVQNHLLPAMGDLPAERLTTALVDEYVAQNLEDPQEGRAGLSAKTISDHLAVLKLIADYAREMGLLPDTVIRFHRPRLHAPAIDILPPEEQAKLESHLLTRLDIYALGVLLTLYTGLRIG